METQSGLCECGCGQKTRIATRTVRCFGWKKGQPIRFIKGHSGHKIQVRHGHARGKGADNLMSSEYRCYVSAKQRCTNPNHKQWHNYGGRGIKFLFKNFEEFLSALGTRPEGLVLDRIDNDGHYEPENMRWTTPLESTRNRRVSKGKVWN